METKFDKFEPIFLVLRKCSFNKEFLKKKKKKKKKEKKKKKKKQMESIAKIPVFEVLSGKWESETRFEFSVKIFQWTENMFEIGYLKYWFLVSCVCHNNQKDTPTDTRMYAYRLKHWHAYTHINSLSLSLSLYLSLTHTYTRIYIHTYIYIYIYIYVGVSKCFRVKQKYWYIHWVEQLLISNHSIYIYIYIYIAMSHFALMFFPIVNCAIYIYIYIYNSLSLSFSLSLSLTLTHTQIYIYIYIYIIWINKWKWVQCERKKMPHPATAVENVYNTENFYTRSQLLKVSNCERNHQTGRLVKWTINRRYIVV